MKENKTLIIVSFATLMESVDATILNTAIPAMSKSFNEHPIDLKLALISYLLSLAIFIPISGWIADKFGIKKVFISAIALFTLSSLWCGYTHSLNELIVSRIFQGIGGSLTIPVGRLVILRAYERHQLVSKMGIMVIIQSFGMMIGPLLGGLIIHNLSWPWIFWVNVPIGLVAITLAIRVLPPMPKIPVPPLDKIGFVLFGTGLATLTYSLSIVSESEIGLTQAVIAFVIAVLLLVGYLLHSKNKKYPIIKAHLLYIRTFQIGVMGNVLTRLSFGGLPFLVPLMLQIILGYSAQLSGLLITPIALGVITAKPLALHLLRLLGYRILLTINTILTGISLLSFATITQQSSMVWIGFLTYFYGFIIAIQYTGMNSLAYANVDVEDMSAATSIMSTIQQLGLSFGVAISAILVTFYSYELTSYRVLNLKTFHYTFISLTILTLLACFIFIHIKNEDGKELIGK
ncbi:MAG: DHA2 family efflux MFS transporter permease subunit [Legionella sp.]|nr:DHA2 family efflux MFS transporter permease subunit [Legionella sp.]